MTDTKHASLHNPMYADPIEQIRMRNEGLWKEGIPLPDPERDHHIRQAWQREHEKCMEEYKDMPLPNVFRIIRQRLVHSGKQAAHELHLRRANGGLPPKS